MSQTIFMIHGMTAGGWIWGNYRECFENKRYTCIMPTLRHHAVDPDAIPDPALGTTSILDYVDDLEKELQYSVLNRTPEKEEKALYDRLGFESGRSVWEKVKEKNILQD